MSSSNTTPVPLIETMMDGGELEGCDYLKPFRHEPGVWVHARCSCTPSEVANRHCLENCRCRPLAFKRHLEKGGLIRCTECGTAKPYGEMNRDRCLSCVADAAGC